MHLLLTISDFHYVRVSLVAWRLNGPSRIKNVDADGGNELKNLIKSKEKDSHPFVLDFKGIVAITDGTLSPFFEEIIGNNKEVHFINCASVKQVIRNLYDEFQDGTKRRLSEVSDKLILHSNEVSLKQGQTEINSQIETYLDSWIKDMVRDCFVPNDPKSLLYKSLSSTPILATGQYDASDIISDPDKFTWVCIRLADMVKSIVDVNSILNAHILSVSLRASPFANAIALLLNLNLRTIDHLGPFQKVWDFQAMNQYGLPSANYIFIGDFIVGGTEMRLAHLFARYNASNLSHAVALGCLLDNSRFQHYEVSSILSLYNLHDDCEYCLFES